MYTLGLYDYKYCTRRKSCAVCSMYSGVSMYLPAKPSKADWDITKCTYCTFVLYCIRLLTLYVQTVKQKSVTVQ